MHPLATARLAPGIVPVRWWANQLSDLDVEGGVLGLMALAPPVRCTPASPAHWPGDRAQPCVDVHPQRVWRRVYGAGEPGDLKLFREVWRRDRWRTPTPRGSWSSGPPAATELWL
jgi:hypothetical protein